MKCPMEWKKNMCVCVLRTYDQTQLIFMYLFGMDGTKRNKMKRYERRRWRRKSEIAKKKKNEMTYDNNGPNSFGVTCQDTTMNALTKDKFI